ncbi:cytochrome b-c1 complex subunit 8 [Athalia rosae]|uniref:cytochrome b-c1 complex subunit 8 n=1 Tax=Athalia rosae TaxID=37344 RepID=UPI00203450E0|nr:cytochrome b-c1 complex subunit 8 [Athalia rosae]
MGKIFGNLAKIRGIVYYRLSPYEQKAFAGALDHGVPNMVRRFRENIFRVGPCFLVSYLVYSWAEDDFARRQRKNPKDYENDV